MEFVLICLMLALVVTTHQYFHDHPTSEMPWSPPYLPLSFIGKYQPYILYSFRSNNPPPLKIGTTLKLLQNENSNQAVIMEEDIKKHPDQKHIENEQSVFPDTQSRVKSFNSDRLSHLNEQTNGRFLFNLFSSSGTYTNSFFKTATFTVYSSVSLTSFVNCVPSTQMLNGAAATACRRKRRGGYQMGSDTNTNIPMVVNEVESKEFSIAPSETLKMVPTAHLPSTPRIHELSSSKEDSNLSSEISADSDSRKKRFFFLDKNQFVVSTTVTSFSFSNTTLTVTRNLLNPAPAACLPAAGANAQCIACLPSGYIVCPAAG